MTSVSILGTGNFAQALAKRLLEHGYKVTCGSRSPSNRILTSFDKQLAAVTVTSIEQAIEASDIVFIALHYEHHSTLSQHGDKLANKIVVDVSNSTSKTTDQSLAERLQSYIPRARVVKAFNTVSAYRLNHDESGQTNAMPICGDDEAAKQHVTQIARNIGFQPYQTGSLQKALEQENKVTELFPGWWIPLIITTVIWCFWFVYSMIHHFVYLTYRAYTPERIPVNITNKAFGCTAIELLALAFLPGCIAAFVQIYRGTKNQPFHWFLDGWLKMRKQFGIYALFCVLFHVVLSLSILDPSYFRSWYLRYSVTVPAAPTADTRYGVGSRMDWKGETAVLLGGLAMGLMVLLGITSIPSLAARLNWREWNFIQSKLGFLCVLLATSHLAVQGIPNWMNEPFSLIVQDMTFMVSWLPWMVIAMRLILAIPPVSKYLEKIRRGWEKAPNDLESGHNMNGLPTPGSSGPKPGFENPTYARN